MSTSEREHENVRRETPPLPVVDPRRQQERSQADDRPEQLPVEEVPRRAVVGERGDRRRGEDHDETDDVEDGDRRAQHHVGRRARQLLAPLEPGDHRSADAGERIPDVAQAVRAGRGVKRWSSRRRLLHAPAHAPRGRSRRRGPRNRRRRRTTRRPVTTTRRRPHARCAGLPRPRRACRPLLRRPRPCPRTRPRPRARLRRTRPRRAGATTSAASTDRSRPLLRPPASSTTESNDATARRVASGFVAFESSYHSTPLASPTRATRWGMVA